MIYINNISDVDNFLELAFEIASIAFEGNPSYTSLYTADKTHGSSNKDK